MLLSIPIAIAASLYRVEWFFPAMLFVIAGRYLTFSTLYGMRIFWLLSAALVAAGSMSVVFQAPVFVGALAGALVEYVVGIFVFVTHRRTLAQH
jgi:acyl dehydratase